MTYQIALVLGLLVAALVLFSFEKLSVDLATLSILAVLVLSGVLTVDEAFAGFANQIIVILAAIFVLSGALMRTGVMDFLGSRLHQWAGGSRNKILLSVMLATAGTSAFMNNTTTTAVFMPAVLGVCRRSRISPSQVLIPLAFASILGGTCTLIGTSTNVAASGYLQKNGLAPFGMFEFTVVGAAAVLAGLLYMMLLGQRLLPRILEESFTERYEIRQYLSEVVITPGSPLSGVPLRATPLAGMDLTVLEIVRGARTFYAGPNGRLDEGDLLIVKATRESLLRVKEIQGVELRTDLELGDSDLITDAVKIVEAIVMPRSELVGRTLKELGFRGRFGVTVLAIYRRGQTLATKLADLALQTGDVLLLQGPSQQFTAIAGNPDLWVLEEVEHIPFRRRKGLIVVGSFALALVLGTLELVPLALAVLLAAVIVVAARCITVEEAYDFIEWPLVILIAGMTAFGLAMDKTGAASYLARLIVDWFEPFGVRSILAGFAVLTVLLTQPMSNAAAALVVLPVALGTAAELGVNPRAFAVMITLAASLSFITPFEPSCILVYGPGRYRFRDFLVTGLPLTALMLLLLLVTVPLLWPL